jgi:alpha-tubulin suppressor-like RCC1 family protein
VRRGVAGLVLAGVLGCQPQPPEGALICTLMADGTEEGCPSAFTCVAPRGDTVGRCYRFPERVDAGTALDAGPPPVFDAGAGDGGAEGDGGPDAGAGDAGIDAGVAAPGIPVDFALGPSHSCALYADGRAFCWGDNVEGQLGRGTQTVTPSTSAAPVIGMPDGALQIEAGTRGNCLRTAEAIHCWGDRVSFFTPGILGVADLANVTQPTEVTLIGEEPPVGLAVGGDHACAIVGPTRSLQCWGFNGNGQLGINSLADQDTPQIVAGISGVEELCAGADHTCARLDDGTVSCWGATSEGLLGIGETMEERVLVPTPVPGLTEVTRLFCGLRHNCALVDDGGTTQLRCWGGNEDGEAGNESGLFLEPVRSPRTVSLGPSTPEESLAEIEEMALGGRNVLIFGFRGFSLMWGAELALHAMGADDVGQLGRGVGSGTPPEEPALVSSLPRAILFADAGDAHACAAVEDGGETSVVCWGWNSRGQLGNTTQTDSRVPVAVVGLPLR